MVVSYSIRENGIKFSTRSLRQELRANELVRYILEGIGFGGGHESMAGGFLPKENWDQDKSIDTYVKHRAISFFEAPRGGVT